MWSKYELWALRCAGLEKGGRLGQKLCKNGRDCHQQVPHPHHPPICCRYSSNNKYKLINWRERKTSMTEHNRQIIFNRIVHRCGRQPIRYNQRNIKSNTSPSNFSINCYGDLKHTYHRLPHKIVKKYVNTHFCRIFCPNFDKILVNIMSRRLCKDFNIKEQCILSGFIFLKQWKKTKKKQQIEFQEQWILRRICHRIPLLPIWTNILDILS